MINDEQKLYHNKIKFNKKGNENINKKPIIKIH